MNQYRCAVITRSEGDEGSAFLDFQERGFWAANLSRT